MDHPTSNELQIGFSTITIQDVDIDKDKGYYKCEVIDHSKNRNSDQILINILSELSTNFKTRLIKKFAESLLLLRHTTLSFSCIPKLKINQ